MTLQNVTKQHAATVVSLSTWLRYLSKCQDTVVDCCKQSGYQQ